MNKTECLPSRSGVLVRDDEEISYLREAARTAQESRRAGARGVSSVIATAGDMVTARGASHSPASIVIKKNVSGNDSDCFAWVGQGRSLIV